MSSPILDTGICSTWTRGASRLSCSRGRSMAAWMTSRTTMRASRAWVRAPIRTSEGMPVSLVSSCRAVTNSRVPATLKSMSPKASSAPRMSVRVTYSPPSEMRPMAMPPTGALMGTPASISDRVEAHTEAIEDRKSTRLNSSHTVIYTLSLHDALPIFAALGDEAHGDAADRGLDGHAGVHQRQGGGAHRGHRRSEEHTSELQSHRDLHSFPTRRSSDLRRPRR